MLAVLAVATVAHVLLTGVRRRRRDMAVLKTLGFTSSQVQGAVAWEATALAAAALLIGIPVGAVAGRWAWALFADAAGIASQATVHVPLVLLAIPVTLLLADVSPPGPAGPPPGCGPRSSCEPSSGHGHRLARAARRPAPQLAGPAQPRAAAPGWLAAWC